MKSLRLTCIIAMTLSAAAMPVSLAAQDRTQPQHQYHHYQLNDVGTFGGPSSYLFAPGSPRAGVLNNRGTLVGYADTATPDPLCFFSPDCYYPHGYQWQNGVKTDLGLLPGGLTGQANWISANGLIAGIADNGQIDPLLGIPVLHGVLYENGAVTDLGTLPEGGNFNFASAVNNRREVVGFFVNTIPDPNSMWGLGYQQRAFYWKNGAMQDLGTLGTGTDAIAALINERGQVVGWSYTNSVPSAICVAMMGFALTTDSFIWDKQSGMKDLGGLGGTCTAARDVNNRGQVIGGAAMTGDSQVHPFVWDAATGMTDLLGASDGNYGYAQGENDRGEVAGGTCGGVPYNCHALLWRKTGGKWKKTNLGAIGGVAFAQSINASEQVIGDLFVSAFLWEDGGPMVDLNTLVSPNSGIQLVEAVQINDRGEIALFGSDANGNTHAVLLIPCDEKHPGIEGCDYSLVDAAAAAAQSAAPRYVPSGIQHPPQSRWSNRYHFPGLGASRPE